MTDVPAPRYNTLRYPLHKLANEELLRLTGGRSAVERKRWPDKPPILTLRCPFGHATARIYFTPRGPLFVAWPMLSLADQQNLEGIQIISQRGSVQELVDLLEVDPGGPHPVLVGWCRCGVRPLDREKIRDHLRLLRVSRRGKRDLVM